MLFNNLPKERPFELFHDYYARAEEHGDKFAEAGCISSVDRDNQPHSRFVNFKYFFDYGNHFFICIFVNYPGSLYGLQGRDNQT